jgi:hypothetical protein
MTGPTLRVKGQALRSVLAALAKIEGNDAHDRAIAALPDDVSTALRSGAIVAGGWYPIEWYAAIYDAASRVAGRPMGRELGRESARADLSGIFRFFTFILSPESIVARAPRIFAMVFEGATGSAYDVRPGHIGIEYRNCVGFTPDIWEDVRAGTEMILERSGAKNVGSRVAAGGGHAPTMRAEFDWG